MRRRALVKTIGLGGLTLSLPLAGWSQEAFARTPLGDGVTLISGAGCNVVVAVGPETATVVDGGLRDHAPALLAQVRAVTGGKPITTLFNTNWRPEHTGLNHLLGEREADIIAQENTRLWQGATFFVDWEDKHYKPMPEAARATRSFFYGRQHFKLGDETVEYGYLPQAHTDGDIYIYFHEANVLVVSDLMAQMRYPLMDYETGGWIGGMQRAAGELLELTDDATRIVASEGGVMTRADLEAHARMYDAAREKVAEGYRSGLSLKEFRALRPMDEFNARWGDPELFVTQLYRGAWGHVRELGGII